MRTRTYRKRWMSLLLSLLLSPVSLWAWQEPDGLWGLTFGQDVRKVIPECPKNRVPFIPPPKSKGACWEPVEADGSSYTHDLIYYLGRIGDQRFDAVHAEQLNHRLAQLLVELPSVSAYYDSLFAILTQRYGSPTSVTGGFNPTATWSGTHVSIRLQYRSHEYSSDHGWLIYWTPRWDRYTRQQTQDAIKKGVQDLK